MLSKSPEVRPNLTRIRDRFSEIVSDQDGRSLGVGFDVLTQAGAAAAQDAAKQEARQIQEQSERERRYQIAEEAGRILKDVVETLFERVSSVCPTARQAKGAMVWSLSIEKAMLAVDFTATGTVLPRNAFHRSGWDVVLEAVIGVTQEQPTYHRSALLLYTDLGSKDSAYRWYEVSYFAPLSSSELDEPLALRKPADADEGIAGGGKYRMASRPYPIDGENTDDFCSRWAEILAKACQGKLEPPRYLPLD